MLRVKPLSFGSPLATAPIWNRRESFSMPIRVVVYKWRSLIIDVTLRLRLMYPQAKREASVHLPHKHGDPQALASGLARQERVPTLRQLPAFALVLRALMGEEARAQKHGMLAVLLT